MGKYDLKKKLAKLPFSTNGHYLRGKDWKSKNFYRSPAERMEDWVQEVTWFPEEFHEKMNHAMDTKTPLDTWVDLGISYSYACSYCEGKARLLCNGVKLRLDTPCPHPDGIISVITLNVPSGKLIAKDDLRQLCPIPGEYDVNTISGQHEMYLGYAKCNQAHGQVGNSSPGIYLKEDGTYVIGLYGVEDDVPSPGEEVGSICTDLWCYSIMDYSVAELHAKTLGLKFKSLLKECSVFEVPPGVYEFTHYYPRGHTLPQVFATFKRVGDPVLDAPNWAETWKNFQVTAGQAVQIKANRWPTLYGKKDIDWGIQVLASMFGSCIPDRDWNPNGFANDFDIPDVDGIEDREIPPFTSLYPWQIKDTALDTACTGKNHRWGGKCPLNPSFAKAAARILECAIKIGVKPFNKEDASVQQAQKERELAVELWPKLVQRYPECIVGMEDFAEWMKDTQAVSEHIKIKKETTPNV